jgi:hypothetical protein
MIRSVIHDLCRVATQRDVAVECYVEQFCLNECFVKAVNTNHPRAGLSARQAEANTARVQQLSGSAAVGSVGRQYKVQIKLDELQYIVSSTVLLDVAAVSAACACSS